MEESNVCSWHRDEPALGDDNIAQGAPPKLPERRGPKPAKAPAAVDNKMRITCQFREPSAMVYDLRSGQRSLEFRIEAPATANESWGAALLVKVDGECAPLRGTGPTRLLAVSALERSSGHLLDAHDWAGLREALSAVRAI